MNTPESLKEFKAKINSFYLIIEPIVKHFNNPQEETILVLLQNLGFDGDTCMNYSFEVEQKRSLNIIEAIQKVAVYYDYHLLNWIVQEIQHLEVEIYHSDFLEEI